MKRNPLELILAHAHTLARAGMREQPDADLLQRFGDGDEAAFSELLHRHGPMVWATCRQTLPCQSDAEDAFQATFLALVKSSKNIRSTQSTGAWLHGVAVRVVSQLKRSAVRRRQREERSAGSEADRPIADSTWSRFHAEVHDEVERLPSKLRTAFVLCDLQGMSQSDAAKQLGWKPGTLTGRLCKARQTLLDRLTRKGLVATSASGLLMLSATNAVPRELCRTVLSYAVSSGDAVPLAISILVTEVTAMTVTKLKLLTATLLVAGGLTGAVGVGFVSDAEGQQPVVKAENQGDNPFSPPSSSPLKMNQEGFEYEFEPTPKELKSVQALIKSRGVIGQQFIGQVTTSEGSSLVFLKTQPVATTTAPQHPQPSGEAFTAYPLVTPQPEVQILKLKHADAETMATMLQQVLRIEKSFPDGVVLSSNLIVADTRTNSLIVRADAASLKMIQKLIESLDVEAPATETRLPPTN